MEKFTLYRTSEFNKELEKVKKLLNEKTDNKAILTAVMRFNRIQNDLTNAKERAAQFEGKYDELKDSIKQIKAVTDFWTKIITERRAEKNQTKIF